MKRSCAGGSLDPQWQTWPYSLAWDEPIVGAVSSIRRSDSGVRPVDPRRDLRSVVELIDVAFGDRLDPAGEVTLAQMRCMARLGPLWWFWSLLGWGDVTPGFVWVEKGQGVVGNVSLRRALTRDGFLIGNVVVHPDWRERGIATALMEAALDYVSSRGGHWVGLEVRADNQVARWMYEKWDFREVERTVKMVRPAGLPRIGESLSDPRLRRGRGRDSRALIGLVRAIIPEPQRRLLEVQEGDYRPDRFTVIERWLGGRWEVWWVIEEHREIRGAVRALHQRGRRPGRLEVLVAPEHTGRFEDILVHKGLASLHDASTKAVRAVLPSPSEALIKALEDKGFEELCVLMQMRLDLVHHISITD